MEAIEEALRGNLVEQLDRILYTSSQEELNRCNEEGHNALMIACRAKCSRECLATLIHAGADPNGTNGIGATALFEAQDCLTAEILLKNGADPTHQTIYGRTVLFSLTSVDLLRVLLDAGANPRCTDINGDTALNYWIRRTYTESIGEMIQLCCRFNPVDAAGYNVIHMAVYHQNEWALHAILQADSGLDLNAVTHGRVSALRCLVDQALVEYVGSKRLRLFRMIRQLADRGANPNHPANYCLLSSAIPRHDDECIKVLFAIGARPTPKTLIVSVLNDDYAMVDKSLEAGISPDAVCTVMGNPSTLYDFAEENDLIVIKEMLKLAKRMRVLATYGITCFIKNGAREGHLPYKMQWVPLLPEEEREKLKEWALDELAAARAAFAFVGFDSTGARHEGLVDYDGPVKETLLQYLVYPTAAARREIAFVASL